MITDLNPMNVSIFIKFYNCFLFSIGVAANLQIPVSELRPDRKVAVYVYFVLQKISGNMENFLQCS